MAIIATIVVIAAMVAERTRPALGALIATLPFSVGPTYVVLAMQHDAAFLSVAALKSVGGASATIVFIAVFARALERWSLPLALAVGFLAWSGAAWIVHRTDMTITVAVLMAGLTVGIASWTTQDLRNHRPALSALRRWWDIPLRALSVATFVAVVTGISSLLGPSGVGTLANFPVIMSSMGVILALRFGPRTASAMLSNSFGGMAGVCVSFLVAHLAMLPLGPAIALSLGLLVSIGWNLGLFWLGQKRVRQKEQIV